MIFAHVSNGKIVGAGHCKVCSEGHTNIPIDEETFKKLEEDLQSCVLSSDGTIVENPKFETLKRIKTLESLIEKYKSKLDALDLKCTRSLRAIISGTDTDEDRDMLDDLESEAQKVRFELRQLEDELKSLQEE